MNGLGAEWFCQQVRRGRDQHASRRLHLHHLRAEEERLLRCVQQETWRSTIDCKIQKLQERDVHDQEESGKGRVRVDDLKHALHSVHQSLTLIKIKASGGGTSRILSNRAGFKSSHKFLILVSDYQSIASGYKFLLYK